MLKSCKYCGRFHDSKYICSAKPNRVKLETEAKHFRSSKRWQIVRGFALERDGYCCRVCQAENGGTAGNYDGIEVHHIIPLAVDITRGDDLENIICLCRYHHEQAECGELDRDYLMSLIVECSNEDIKDL